MSYMHEASIKGHSSAFLFEMCSSITVIVRRIGYLNFGINIKLIMQKICM